ncbi:hypothetical protein ACQEVZ_55175 [Dactylosporangium sp. CA-152071]|uniref:hypothetical protein n=1 Tax=Dactylosporangium sp. CA-152071 TaxID=3239933 RepID=UPI003D8FAF2A
MQALNVGTMSRGWRVIVSCGSAAVKEVLDVDVTAVRREVAACRAPAALGLPVPGPVTADDGAHVLEDGGAASTAARRVDGVSRSGADLGADEAWHAGSRTRRDEVRQALPCR